MKCTQVRLEYLCTYVLSYVGTVLSTEVRGTSTYIHFIHYLRSRPVCVEVGEGLWLLLPIFLTEDAAREIGPCVDVCEEFDSDDSVRWPMAPSGPRPWGCCCRGWGAAVCGGGDVPTMKEALAGDDGTDEVAVAVATGWLVVGLPLAEAEEGGPPSKMLLPTRLKRSFSRAFTFR